MGSIRITTCDRDGKIDSEESRVLRVSVCGAWMELCEACRLDVLKSAGVAEELAAAFLEAHDQHSGMGPKPSLAGVQKALDSREPAPVLELIEGQAPAEEALDVPVSSADDGEQATGTTRKREKASAK